MSNLLVRVGPGNLLSSFSFHSTTAFATGAALAFGAGVANFRIGYSI